MTSSEMGECRNATYNGFGERERASRSLGPHEFFRYIEECAAMFAGLADSTLSRDDGYRFFLLGRSIKRVDMIGRMLLAYAADRPTSRVWVSVFRSIRQAEKCLEEPDPQQGSHVGIRAEATRLLG